jgi:hypothetical protein
MLPWFVDPGGMTGIRALSQWVKALLLFDAAFSGPLTVNG